MASEDASGAPAARVQIEAIQTVVSMRPTDPPLARKVALKQDVEKVFRKCHHVLLYYKKANDEDSGWVMVGRLKESLGRALCYFQRCGCSFLQ
uniref:Uncharacterized protein n=1 Tax=Kalanchoe fedtschenkoi TaxID=63787 RepID=A0A7N1A8Z9_KALFE